LYSSSVAYSGKFMKSILNPQCSYSGVPLNFFWHHWGLDRNGMIISSQTASHLRGLVYL
jgi:hypothetical protein